MALAKCTETANKLCMLWLIQRQDLLLLFCQFFHTAVVNYSTDSAARLRSGCQSVLPVCLGVLCG